MSHTWADKGFVKRLAADLVASGARVWVDEAEIMVGDSLIEKIQDGIDSMDYLAVVLSPDSVSSEWVKREVNVAMNEEIAGKKVKVLPILYKECDLPGFLKGKLYADFTEPSRYAASLQMIIRRLSVDTASAKRSHASIQEFRSETTTTLANEEARDSEEHLIHGQRVTFTRRRGTVISARDQVVLKYASGEKETLDVRHLPGISRGDSILFLTCEGLSAHLPVPLLLLNYTSGESRDLVRAREAIFRLGLVSNPLGWIIIAAVCIFGASRVALEIIFVTVYKFPDSVNIAIFLASLAVPVALLLTYTFGKQREIASAQSDFEASFLEVVGELWD